MAAASDDEKLGIVKTEGEYGIMWRLQRKQAAPNAMHCATLMRGKPLDDRSACAELRDGSIMFRFGEEADSSSASAAATDAAKDAGSSSKAADAAAAAAGAEVTAAIDDSPASDDGPATDDSPAPAQSTADPAAADEVPTAEADSAEAFGAEISSSDDDPHAETEAAGSVSQSVDKQQLQDMKVGVLSGCRIGNDAHCLQNCRRPCMHQRGVTGGSIAKQIDVRSCCRTGDRAEGAGS